MARKSKTLRPLCLDRALDLKAATPLAEALLARRGDDLVIDAASVERLGAQCLQVLLTACASWQADGHSFRVEGLPESVIPTLTLLGVTPEALQFQRDVSA